MTRWRPHFHVSPGLRSMFARIWAVTTKEFIQMRRDRLTLAMMIVIPFVQLMLFGYAINTDPKHLPTAVIIQDNGRLSRSLVAGLQSSGYFNVTRSIADPAEASHLLRSGEVAFVVTIPTGFTRAALRGDRPQILVEADAADPSSASNALGQMQAIVTNALRNDLKSLRSVEPTQQGPVDVVVHRKYNPEGRSAYSIVPAVTGIILLMTMLMLTSIAMTRETERGTLENLLAMPAQPLEVMIGKLAPYVLVGAIQTIIVITTALLLFHIPFFGSPWVLILGLAMFIIANLATGFLISTVARTQMQAMQMTIFIFLPCILLSGFMFPFKGMPPWARAIGEVLPITHFMRVIRGVMLKGASAVDLMGELLALLVFTLAISALAMLRYRRTLD